MQPTCSRRLSARWSWSTASAEASLARVAVESSGAFPALSASQKEDGTEDPASGAVLATRATAREALTPSALCATLALPSAAILVSLLSSWEAAGLARSDSCDTCSAWTESAFN